MRQSSQRSGDRQAERGVRYARHTVIRGAPLTKVAEPRPSPIRRPSSSSPELRKRGSPQGRLRTFTCLATRARKLGQFDNAWRWDWRSDEDDESHTGDRPNMPQRKTGKERVLESIKRLVEESEKLEAELSRTEDQLGLARSDATSSWDDRLQRIADRRAELAAQEREWLKAHEDLDAYLENGGRLSDLYPPGQDNWRRLKPLAEQLGQDTFARLAKFLRRATAAVPDGETGREALTEEQLRSLWRATA